MTAAQVYAASGVDVDDLAQRITAGIPEVRAVPPLQLRRQFEAGNVSLPLKVPRCPCSNVWP